MKNLGPLVAGRTMGNAFEKRAPRNAPPDKSEDTIVSRFERQVATVPNHPAVMTEDGSVTYRELGAVSDSVATHLGALASPRELPIGLLMAEGPGLIAGMLGALKIGRPFIALDANFSEGWLSQVMADAGMEYIVTDTQARQTADRIAGTRVKVLDMEQLSGSRAPSVIASTTSPDTPAFIVYTSGSTGRPKGVVLSHRTALHTPDVRAELLRLRSGDRVANLRSSGVVAGIHNSLLPLLNGACLLPFDLHRRGLHGLTPWLNTEKITGITFSGSLLRTWLSSLDEDARFASLRFVIASSEPLYGADVVALAGHLEGDWRIMHTLVSTETGIIAAQMFDPSSHLEPGIVPVGQIVPNTVIRLERDDGTLAGPGESGEIIVKSPFLAQGYWNDPDATARAFRHDVDGKTRIYRSGDLGRWRIDGSLQHLGRKNRKIKLRGYSVEPYEVECALSALPGVREAIVTVTESGPDDVRLIAYVVSNGDTSVKAGRAFRAAVAKSLPAHMVPSHVIVLKSLPLTPRGKVDRAALPPAPSLDLARMGSRAPSCADEHALAAIWQNALKIPKVGVDDNFYELGGTSLQAFLIFSGIARTFGRDLPPSTMLETPTIEKQAALLRDGASPRNVSKLIGFRETGSEAALFLVHAAFGDIAYAGELARHLKSDRPVFGLRPPKLDGSEPVCRTMEAIAAGYVTEIRQVQRKGPYFLAGHSFGGRVAFEMAQQLTRQGETVEFLGLIDTYAPTGRKKHETAVPRVARHITALRKSRLRTMIAYVGERAAKNLAYACAALRLAALERLPKVIAARFINPPSYGLRPDLYERMHKKAIRRYAPRSYRGHMVVFSAEGLTKFHQLHWRPLTLGGLSVIEIPGATHGSIVWAPHSAKLAAAFDNCLGSAEHASQRIAQIR